MTGERRRRAGTAERRPLRLIRVIVTFAAVAVCVYLVLRAAVEPFVIDLTEPASYETGWGGPTLPGVLAVHMLPGVIALLLLIAWFRRGRRRPASGDRSGLLTD